MNTEFPDRAIAARNHANLSQTAAGKKIGVSRAAISQWENGETKSINSAHLHKAAKVYGVSPAWLASGEGEMLADLVELTPDAREFMNLYEKLTKEQRADLLARGASYLAGEQTL